MKKAGIAAAAVIAILLIACEAFLIILNIRLKEAAAASSQKFSEELSIFRTLIMNHHEYIDSQMQAIQEDILTARESQCQNTAELQKRLSSIKNRTDSQYTQTVSMKETYDALLNEQKKKTVDITAKDSEIIQMKTDAELFYSKNNFSAAYEECKKVLSFQSDDMEALLLKIKSLYYMNRADSSKYSKILEDIKTLKENGHIDEETREIEMLIKAEREGLSE